MSRTAALALVLLVATGLRLPALDAELWHDELVARARVVQHSLGEVLTVYDTQNQHVLYSFLAKLTVGLLGDTPTAMRAPAVVFGVLGVAAVYALGRALLSTREALLAAALLAVSYQHVWFSQNARGYTGLLFWTLVASRLLERALRGGRTRDWIGFGVATALGFYTHLTMAFVTAGHAALVVARLRGDALRRGPVLGFALAGALAIALYAPMLPRVLAVSATEGRDGVIATWSSPRWAMAEVLRSLGASFASLPAAVAVAAVGLLGAWQVRRRCPDLLWLAVAPVAIGLVVTIASGHHVWPRLFFFAIGYAALLVAAGFAALADRIGDAVGDRAGVPAPGVDRGARARRLVFAAAAAIVLLVAASSLPGAYGTKQRFADALALVEGERRPGDVVAVAGTASRAYHDVYATDWVRVRTRQDLDAARAGALRTWVVHTFPIELRARRPDVARALDEEFEVVARFAGTLHGGDVVVWRSRPAPALAAQSHGGSALSPPSEVD